jgi:type IV secretory pathway VirB4 component
MLDGFTSREKAIIDKAILKTYKIFGWTSKKKGIEFPLLKDLYSTLLKMEEFDLSNRIEKYVNGSLSKLFNKQTNVELKNRLIVFEIKHLPESIKSIMMLVLASHINGIVKVYPKRRLLVIDEGWKLLENKETARFMTDLVRRGRKYYLGVNIITQQANDFLNNEYGRALVSQSSLRILMKQDTTTIKKVVNEFALSEYERNFLLTCDKGEALIIADQNHVSVQIVTSKSEHPLLTTDPKELLRTSV